MTGHATKEIIRHDAMRKQGVPLRSSQGQFLRQKGADQAMPRDVRPQMRREVMNRLQQSDCHRCGGLMVGEFCMDMLDDSGETDFTARRCIQCGETIDPVILINRYRQVAHDRDGVLHA